MKLFSVALKELKLVKSQRVAIALIILYPLLVVGSIGLGFSQFTISSINVAVVAPPEVNFLLNDLNASKAFKINLIELDSFDKVNNFIKSGFADIGLIIEKPTQKFSQIKIKILFDNTKRATSSILMKSVESVLFNIAFKTTQGILSELWDNLLNADVKLQSQVNLIDSFLVKLNNTGERLTNVSKRLQEVNLVEVKSVLSSQESNVKDFNKAQDKIVFYEDEITVVKSDLVKEKNSVVGYKADVVSNREKLKTYKSNLLEIKSLLVDVNDFLQNALKLNPNNLDLIKANEKLIEVNSNVDSSLTEIDLSILKLNKAENDLSALETKLDLIDKKLSNALTELKTSRTSINSASTGSINAINFFNNKISSIQQSLDDVNSLVQSGLSSRVSIKNDLNSSKQLIVNFIGSLKEFKKYPKEFIARPFILIEENVFKMTVLSSLIPAAIALVLLLSLMLLTSVGVILEKSEGVLLRMRLSASSKFTLFFGKLLGQLFIGLVMALIILVLGIFAFDLQISGSLIDLFLVLSLVSITFISIGLLIASATSNQSTAIMTCLLLIMPMFFLSGIILPIDFMPEIIKSFSLVLPLTLANNLLTGVIIKGNALILMLKELITLFSMFLIFFIYSVLRT